jgi:uncharacterized protein (TIGR02266 family)
MPAGGFVKTVLIGDDTAFVRERFVSALADAGHQAIAVHSAAELLARVRSEGDAVDLIVVDLHLPHSRGLDLVREIRRIDAGRTPIVIFSGTIADAGEVRELAALGIAGYINEYSAPPHILPALAPHLFPDNFNRRSSPRVSVSMSVSYRVGNQIASALTLNLSKGGVAVRTMSPLERDTVARLRFRLPGTGHDVEVEARVRWTDRNVGMGLQFEKMSPAHQVAIDEFIDRHFFSNRRA